MARLACESLEQCDGICKLRLHHVFAIYMGALERTLQVQTKCLTIAQISIVLRANNYAKEIGDFQSIEYSNLNQTYFPWSILKAMQVCFEIGI